MSEYGIERPPWHRTRCAYCRTERAVNRDHVVPKSIRRRISATVRPELLATVPACLRCNLLKGARHLVPPSWAKYVDELNEVIGGSRWRVWHGTTSEPAYAEAWK